MFCLLQSALWSFTRRNRGVKLPRHPPSLPLCNSFHDGRGLARRAGSIERTGTRAVAECLGAVAALARIPLIDDHLHRIPYSNFQIADLVELNDLETRIGNRQCFAGDASTHLELVFGLRAFPHANEKFSGLTPPCCRAP